MYTKSRSLHRYRHSERKTKL